MSIGWAAAHVHAAARLVVLHRHFDRHRALLLLAAENGERPFLEGRLFARVSIGLLIVLTTIQLPFSSLTSRAMVIWIDWPPASMRHW